MDVGGHTRHQVYWTEALEVEADAVDHRAWFMERPEEACVSRLCPGAALTSNGPGSREDRTALPLCPSHPQTLSPITLLRLGTIAQSHVAGVATCAALGSSQPQGPRARIAGQL